MLETLFECVIVIVIDYAPNSPNAWSDGSSHTTTTTTRLRQACDLCFLRCEHMEESSKRPSAGGVAMRRRQRRLCSWWRHEQRSVAAALAAATHHSAPRSGWPEQHNAPRGPTTASAMEGEVREVYEVLREQKPPLPGMRPAPLSEVAGPLGRLVAPACPSGGVPALVPVVMVFWWLSTLFFQYCRTPRLLC